MTNKKIFLWGFGIAAFLFFLAAFFKPDYPYIVGNGDTPPWNFYYGCTAKGAMRVYKTHDGRWACRTKEGKTMIYSNWADDLFKRSGD